MPWNPSEVEAYIRQQASARGIDPNTAVAVARSEGLNNPVGDAGLSFGPFQLYTGGGLGNAFQAQTGQSAANYLDNWRLQVQWILNWVVQHGWNPGGVKTATGATGGGMHGATHIGIGNWQGVIGSQTVPLDFNVNGSGPSAPQTGSGGEGGIGVQPTTGLQSTPTGNAATRMSLNFPDSLQHTFSQFFLVILGVALLIGGIYLIGSSK